MRSPAREGDNLYIFPSTGQRVCRQCFIAKARRWQEANIAKHDAALVKYRRSEKGRAARRARRKTTSGRASKARYNRKHGITNHRRRRSTTVFPTSTSSQRTCLTATAGTVPCVAGPTPQSLRGTVDPAAPELGHIVPLSTPGSPGHVYSNVRCECRDCNGTKSNMADADLLPTTAP